MKPVPPPNLDPGSLRARVQLRDFSEAETHYVCDLLVRQVVEHGPQSRPIGSDVPIQASLAKRLVQGGELTRWKDDDVELEAVLALQQTVAGLEGRLPAWKLTSLSLEH